MPGRAAGPDGTIWAVTRSALLHRTSDDDWRALPLPAPIGASYFGRLAVDALRAVWVLAMVGGAGVRIEAIALLERLQELGEACQVAPNPLVAWP